MLNVARVYYVVGTRNYISGQDDEQVNTRIEFRVYGDGSAAAVTREVSGYAAGYYDRTTVERFAVGEWVEELQCSSFGSWTGREIVAA